jgi:hypothetical protein
MKKTIIVFGTIAGIIAGGWLAAATLLWKDNPDFESGMWMGYASMILAFSLIFVGIRNYRDKFNGGYISFGKAFKTGALIALVASTVYVLIWVSVYYLAIPDYMEKYSSMAITKLQNSGATATEISAQKAQMDSYVSMYKNPLMVVVLTYLEILPVGLVISLIASLILKKKVRT